jgi:hemolysin III
MSLSDPYPAYPRDERIADAILHVAGVGFALIGTVLLVIWSGAQASGTMTLAVVIYDVAMTASFVASACYHFTPKEHLRPVLRRFDHAAIYLKIAGTYTPLVMLIGSAFAYSVLAVVWALAAISVTMKLFF